MELCEDLPSKINGHIYQGNLEASKNLIELKKLGISHIVIAGNYLDVYHPKEFVYLKLKINDDESEDIKKHFHNAYEFISNAISNDGKILIHCSAGISRSSSITMCYLIKSNKYTVDEALKVVKDGRPIACPNSGFYKQLNEWYREEVLGEKVTTKDKKEKKEIILAISDK
jgi:protein-tyrosine phosphatase